MPSIAQSSCKGATAGGALTQLLALGAADVYITQGATITYWRFRYNKHTNFAMESIEQAFNTQVAFGGQAQAVVNRTGDLIYFLYVVFDLPGIKAIHPQTTGTIGFSLGGPRFPCPDPCDPCADGPEPDTCDCVPAGSSAQPLDEELLLAEGDIDTCTGLDRPWAHWVNAIGQWLVRRACIVIGGQTIDVLYNDFLFMWEELSGQPGKRLTEMIGKRFTLAQLVQDSLQNRRLYVPLPFWFTRISGNALPLVSLQFHAVSIHVCFSDLISSIQVSDCDVIVVKCIDCQPLNNNDLGALLDITYIYLDKDERERFAVSCFEYLITQTQIYTETRKAMQINMHLNFNHPVIELIWAVKRLCQESVNNHFVYSGKFNRDPIRFATLSLNNMSRWGSREATYFRLVQPYQHHTNIPDAFIYVYSFALYPELPSPSGSANFSRIDNVNLVLDLQDELADEDVIVIVFARNWNVFRLKEGLGGIGFAN